MSAAAGRQQPHDQHPLGLVDDAQSAGLADDDEPAPDPALELMQCPVPAAHLLVGDQLQRDRMGEPGGQLTEDLRGQQPRHLHVLGAAGEQAVPVATRAELAGRSRDDVQVGVEYDAEIPAFRPRVHQGARLPAGLEPLHREAGPDEVEDIVQGPPQLARPLAGRGDGQQLTGAGEEHLSIHDPMVTPVRPVSRALCRNGAGQMLSKTRQVVVACAYRVPSGPVIWPDAVATRRPALTTRPVATTLGVPSVSALTMFTFSSSVV